MTAKERKQAEDNVKIVFGASQVLVAIFSALGTFLTVVDWPLERKLIWGVLLSLAWVASKTVAGNRSRRRAGRKKLPWLLDLYVAVQRKSKPWARQVLLKALFFRILDLALVAVIATILLAAFFSSAEGQVREIIDPPTLTPTVTETPTLTQTLTLTPSPTITLTPTATTAPPASASDYYMIVLDASATMLESFDGRTKREAARESLEIILAALNPKSHYGLVVVGGSEPKVPDDLCGKPSEPVMPFDSMEDLNAQLGQLPPVGGGSFFNGYVLGKRLLEDLPVDTVKTLIYITGSSDACEARDEWKDLEKILALPHQVGLYSEIIILDEDGLKSRTIAEQINSLSDTINVQVAETNEELEDIVAPIVVDNVVEYVSTQLDTIGEEVPARTPEPPLAPSPTLTSSPTTTNPPPTTIAPSNTSTTFILPTVTPSKTSTPIPPTQTPPPTAAACQSLRQGRLNGASYGGTVTIASPEPCSTDHLPGSAIEARGTYSGIPQGKVIWVFVYPPNGPYYPQSPFACQTPIAPPPNQSNGNWDVPTYLGNPGDPPKWFDIVVTVADPTASNYIAQRLSEDCSNGNYDGITTAELSQMNIDEKTFITVRTK